MSAFNGSLSIKTQALERAAQAVEAGLLQPWNGRYHKESGKTAPFAALLKDGDYALLPGAFGIPPLFARLYEVIFFGFSKYHEEGGVLATSLSPDAGKYFLDLIESIPIGADLDAVPARFVTAVLQALARPNAILPKGPSGEVQAAMQDLANLYETALSGQTDRADWKTVRKAAVKLADSSPAAADRLVCKFVETVAWPPGEFESELTRATSGLVNGFGRQAYSDAITAEETDAQEKFTAALEKLTMTLNRRAEENEVAALPEHAVLNRVLPASRRAELSAASTDMSERVSLFLQVLFVRMLAA
jgi:hypothetical protein